VAPYAEGTPHAWPGDGARREPLVPEVLAKSHTLAGLLAHRDGRARRRALSSSKLAFPLRANGERLRTMQWPGMSQLNSPASDLQLRVQPQNGRRATVNALAFPFHRAGPDGRRTNQRCL
jgi:hypothetical protein